MKNTLQSINELLHEISRRKEDHLLSSLYKDNILDDLYSDALFIKITLEGNSLNGQVLKDLEIHMKHFLSIIQEDCFSPFFYLTADIERLLE
ncbi:hypothetical protein CEQ21_07730 (plasmid) [Niallia circulans]|uniref:Uncharacterized protein n=1 Tax=Niallia circulans TaxID=1397 RepID=A0A553SQH9_NIACI|nr:hypothetical protein [Niallia circulans]TRZ39249.1 hypothetical protein CEQ21_07730 [Niallia circulans]